MNSRTKLVKCGLCEGTGCPLIMGEETCPRCAGTGRDKTSDLWSEPCLSCNGHKKVTYCRRSHIASCTPCNGFGFVTIRY